MEWDWVNIEKGLKYLESLESMEDGITPVLLLIVSNHDSRYVSTTIHRG